MIDETNSAELFAELRSLGDMPIRATYGLDYRAAYLALVASSRPRHLLEGLTQDYRLLSASWTRGSCDGEERSLWLAPRGQTYYVNYGAHHAFTSYIDHDLYCAFERAGFVHVSGGRADLMRPATPAQSRYIAENYLRVDDMTHFARNVGKSCEPLPDHLAMLNAVPRHSWDWRDPRHWPHMRNQCDRPGSSDLYPGISPEDSRLPPYIPVFKETYV